MTNFQQSHVQVFCVEPAVGKDSPKILSELKQATMYVRILAKDLSKQYTRKASHQYTAPARQTQSEKSREIQTTANQSNLVDA